MRAVVYTPQLQGTVHVPPSKSFMQRVCALALLNRGTTIIRNPGISNDDKAALNIIRSLGARIIERVNENTIWIESDGLVNPGGLLHAGESGLAARMFIPLAALSTREITITGEGTLLKRSMHWFDDVLPSLGVEVISAGGMLPFRVKGPLIPKNITVDAAQSSQYISGLMMAMGYAATKPVTLRLYHIVSFPYLNLTIRLMKHFGYTLDWNGSDEVVIHPHKHNSEIINIEVDVEGDWSAAAALLVAGAVGGRVSLTGLTYPSLQGDAAIMEVLKNSGAQVDIMPDQITVTQSPSLTAFNYHAEHTPDLFPVLSVLALYARGTSTISGVSRLWNKESNRAHAVIELIKALGGSVEIHGDVMHIHGPVRAEEVHVHSFNDHRMVMAAAVATAGSAFRITIDDAEAINKSYPDFFKDISKLGAQVSLT
ncbi:MAG TPA: 3-phosphoshikimate 1-carboxyvinyltransferase [Ferruginibacter sp.]|nr:3-phosphoshikimate 1-carboxyvinyltransferase [Ferruginibacter sp.]